MVPLVIGALGTASKGLAKRHPRYKGFKWLRPDVGLFGNRTCSQKGVASLSCGREPRCDIEYQARIESWKECTNDHNNSNKIIIIIIIIIVVVVVTLSEAKEIDLDSGYKC